MNNKLRAVAITAAVSTVAGVGFSNYSADASTPAHVHVSTVKANYSDFDYASLLLTGTGRLAKAHPELVHQLGFDRLKGRAPQAQITTFINAFLKDSPTFHSTVVTPLRSGDPYQVDNALRRVTTLLKSHLIRTGALRTVEPGGRNTADGWYKTRTTVVTNFGGAVNLGVLVNGGLYANVAVATEAVVAAAVVWLAGVFLTYQFDPSSQGAIDRQNMIAAFTKSMASAA